MKKIKKPLKIKIDFSKIDTDLLWHTATSSFGLINPGVKRFVAIGNQKSKKLPEGTVFFFDRYLEAFIFSQIHGGGIAVDNFDDSFCVFTTLDYNKI